MKNAKRIADEAKRTGTVFICGEMEFPANQGPRVAFDHAAQIAEACGYVVSWQGYSRSAFTVTGGDIIGYAVVDWYHPDTKELVKVELWTPEMAWLQGV